MICLFYCLFMQKHNDASKNDKAEKLDDATMQNLREMGAFGLQAPEKYGLFFCLSVYSYLNFRIEQGYMLDPWTRDKAGSRSGLAPDSKQLKRYFRHYISCL